MVRRPRLALVVAALAMLFGALPAAAPPALAATLSGYDISWPQCPASVGGFGLPLPPTSTQFVIVGLTKGLPFTRNPCLQDQVNWVRSNDVPAQAYTIAAFPTAAQLTDNQSGPWGTATREGRLLNVGYAEAAYAVDSLHATGFTPPMVWIDVEPRPAQPWPTATAAQKRENRLVIAGLMRGLHDAGLPYGLYSYTSAWESITGSWWLPGVPVWATAGRLDYPTEAQDRCVQPSFSGGHVYLAQWYDDTRDYDLTCGSYGFTPLPMPPSSQPGLADFTGDWGPDLLARERATGLLWDYSRLPYSSNVLWGGWGPIGQGWQIFTALNRAGDVNGDGTADVLARDTAGDLWLYPGNGTGGWLPWSKVGTGWNVMTAIVTPGDFTGDQRPDVLARDGAGDLWLYPGNGSGGWLPRVKVGTGWNVMTAIVGPGDFNGDGTADILARDGAGDLWLYPGNGSGGWLPRVKVGTGWNVMTAIVGAGDFNTDGTPDVLARDTAGNLWLYPGNGLGGWLLPRLPAGTGWNIHDILF